MNILVCRLVHVHMLYVNESAFCMCVSVSEGVDVSWQGLWSFCVSTCECLITAGMSGCLCVCVCVCVCVFVLIEWVSFEIVVHGLIIVPI